jgi:hypothetical protein
MAPGTLAGVRPADRGTSSMKIPRWDRPVVGSFFGSLAHWANPITGPLSPYGETKALLNVVRGRSPFGGGGGGGAPPPPQYAAPPPPNPQAMFGAPPPPAGFSGGYGGGMQAPYGGGMMAPQYTPPQYAAPTGAPGYDWSSAQAAAPPAYSWSDLGYGVQGWDVCGSYDYSHR